MSFARRPAGLLLCAVFFSACQCDSGTKTGTNTCTPHPQCGTHDCGDVDDGCGKQASCGTCTGSDTCGGGGTAGTCGHACVPNPQCGTHDCGTVDDGCGATSSCGTCSGTDTCGGGGTPNVCGTCVAKTCSQLTACGAIDDGCGTTLHCACAFVEEFTDTSRIDTTATTAIVDAVTGVVRDGVPRDLGDPGDGADGVWKLTAGASIPGGTFHYASVDIETTDTIEVTGALTLYVQHDFTFTGGGTMNVHGPLTIIVGGAFRIDCAFVYAYGAAKVHQPSNAGIYVGCEAGAAGEADLWTADDGTSTTTPSLEIWTRGAVTVGGDGYLKSADPDRTGAATVGTGDLEILAYGDVITGHDAYLIIGSRTSGTLGELRVFTEGRILVDDDTYFTGGHEFGNAGGGIKLHARGNIELHNASYVDPAAGDLEVLTEGDLIVAGGKDGGSYLDSGHRGPTTPKSIVRAHNIVVDGQSYIDGGDGGGSTDESDLASTLDIAASGDVTVTNSSVLSAASATCGAGGAVTLVAGGTVTFDASSQIIAGDAETCSTGAFPGGAVSVVARGDVTLASPSDNIVPGRGSGTAAAGTQTITPHATTAAPVIDAGLVSHAVLVSLPITARAQPAKITDVATKPSPITAGADVSLVPDTAASTTCALASCTGASVGAHFGYVVHLDGRLFDGTSLDALSFDYQ